MDSSLGNCRARMGGYTLHDWIHERGKQEARQVVPKGDILMNTYQWTCLACKSPNVLVHDESREGQIALNCQNCGEPGVFEPKKSRIRQSPGFPHAYTMATMSSACAKNYVTRAFMREFYD